MTGLDGNLTLTNNGVDTLVVTASGPFAFPTRVASSLTYQVAIAEQPVGQTCTLQRESGAVGTADVTSVVIACATGGGAYAVSGVVTGLFAGVSLTLAVGTQTVDVDASEPNFIFPQNVATGTNYDIRVTSQPAGATCAVEGGVGTVAAHAISDIVVVCLSNHYSFAGVVSGLVSGDSVVLQSGSGGSVTVTGGGSGTDAGALPGYVLYGQAYTLGVASQPGHASCIVPVAMGTVTGNVTVPVTCIRQSLPLNVSVAGLPSGAVVQLHNNGGAAVSVTGNGSGQDSATLDAAAVYNGTYNVGVVASPAGYSCTVPAATGTIQGLAPVVVNVACTAATYVLQAQVSGLASAGRLGLSVNQGSSTFLTGGGTLSDNANLSTAVAYNASYTVAITSSPNNQACSITSGASGTGGFSPTVVQVSCVTGYRLFVTVSGLVAHAAPISLLDTYGASSSIDTLYVNNANNGAPMAFPMHLPSGTAYAVTVAATPGYQCTFSGTAASGTSGASDITGIMLNCNVSLSFTTQQAASVVLGQGTMTQTFNNRASGVPAANSMHNPAGNPYVAPDGTVYISDTGNARVLGYMSLPNVSGAAADFVLGQPSWSSTAQAISPNGFSVPLGIFGTGSAVFVADYARLLVYRSLPHTNVNADAVMGQADFTSNTGNPLQNQGGCSVDWYGPFGAGGGAVNDANLLVVPDTGDYRMLLFDEFTVSAEPDAVLGQAAYHNCFIGSGGSGAHAYNLSFITSASIDGQRLYAADRGDNRVLVWDNLSALNTGTSADHVIGQANLDSSSSGLSATALNQPASVLAAHGQLFVADTQNHRVLIWNTAPSGGAAAYSTPPDAILGQADANSGACNSNGSASATTLCSPQGLAIVGTSLLVSDHDNNRVLIYKSH